MALSHGAPLKSSTLGIYATVGGAACLELSEKRVVMGQGASSPVFANG